VATSAFSDWKPRLQASVDDLKLEVNKLHKAWDRVAMDRSGSGPGILEHPLSASMRPPAGFSTDGPDGHHVETNHQDLEFGKVFTHSHIPVKGTSHNFPPFAKPPASYTDSELRPIHNDCANSSRLPKLPFPSFDGPNPKLWISRCESYFDMYSVPSNMWIRVAGHYCTGPAERWL